VKTGSNTHNLEEDIMTTRHDAQDNADMWDNRDLGASEEHAEAISPSLAAEFDDMMELQAISIRLQKSLLSNLKTIAAHHQIGYQPMVRDLLTRFAEAEMKKILIDQLNKIDEAQRDREKTVPVTEFIEDLRNQA
jgi:predicted DNA binding CopG/RHH family protein